jgi:hypothetical protein
LPFRQFMGGYNHSMKPIQFDGHTLSRMALRGDHEDEVITAIRETKWEGAKKGRFQCRKSFSYLKEWNGKTYNTKQVKVIFEELETEIIVDTVYVFYF